MAIKLFAYGTIRKSHAPSEIADAVRCLRLLGKGTVRGKLYDLGDYPAAIFEPQASTLIEGNVYEVPNVTLLNKLDAYEEFDPRNPADSLFIRKRRKVRLIKNGEETLCWVYEYNGPISRELETVA